MRIADNGGFGNLGVRDERAFNFGCPKSVARNIEHIINTTCNPVIPVFIAAAAIAGEIFTRILHKICVDEALMVAINRAHLPRPAICNA